MHTGLLDMLHDSGNKHSGAVIQSIDVDFDGIIQEAVDQDGMIGADVGRVDQVVVELVVVIDDLHTTAAQHIRRPHQDRIPDVIGNAARFGGTGRHAVLGCGQPGVV